MDLNRDFPSLEQLVPLMPGHVYLLDKNGIYRGCNDLQAKNLGLKSRQEIIGKTNKSLAAFQAHPSLITVLDSNNNKVMQLAKPLEFEEYGPFPDGHIGIFKSYKMPIFDKDKNVIGLLGMSFDISEAKSELAELLRKQSQTELALDNIMANLPGHVYWVDLNERFLGCNDQQAIDFGLTDRNEIVGLSVKAFQTPENAEAIIRNNEKVIHESKNISEEENFINKEGKQCTYLSNKVPLKDKSGKVVGLLGISFDITDLKQAQENEKLALRQKAAAEESTKRALLIFSGMATHDLRTPLSSVQLRAAFLKKYISPLLESYQAAITADLDVPLIQTKVLSDLPQAPEDILQAVREANTYIDASLKSLKAAATSEGLMDQGQLVDCNAERLLRRIVDNYPYKPGEEALVHYHTDCDFNFKGNEIFFNRLVENLIKNAFEQIHLKGKGEIFIWCEESPELNTLHLKDTAGGVSQALIDHLFSGIHSSKPGGTGIGLSSAKQIMQGMNGDISARLVDGDCIEFVLSFPKV